ncbi:DUF1569 domain-containing protein [Chitinophaga sp. SYP-B3965]|uniref:DinB family protein n=1 Tax=Chitinophaga sp. SYP-B3965 TaxID=2663120 RepID=UPI001299D5C8|nr:DinB family protein [Chitinophaga sp. SYP-B3965]MRG45203.1 DUF1569 domain-containing protein [Chitinophaga sp. SYP-B3965]
MRTVFDKAIRDALIQRAQMLNGNNTAAWGKMNVHQMVKHCTLWEEMTLGKTHYKREFLGLLLGKLVKKSFFKNDKPMDKNVPAGPLAIKGPVQSDFAADKKKWINLIEEYGRLTDHSIIHPFFGKLTKEEIGLFAFKHSDHHLRQFNC